MTGYWKRRKGNYSAGSKNFYWIRSLAVSYTYKAHSDNYNPTLFSSPSTPILPPLLPNAPVSHSIFLCIAVAVLRLIEFTQHLPYDHGFKTHWNMGSSLGDTLLKQIIAFPQNPSVANLVQQGENGLSTPLWITTDCWLPSLVWVHRRSPQLQWGSDWSGWAMARRQYCHSPSPILILKPFHPALPW